MRTCNRFDAVVGVSAVALVLLALGCDPEPPARQTTAPQKTAEPDAKSPPTLPAAATTAAADLKEPAAGSGDAKKVSIGSNVSLEVRGKRRRVLINAYVCLREGQLEQLMCRRGTKEHEAILAADCDARDIATGLLATGAKAGTPVKYSEDGKETIPPTGQRIKVTLQYRDKGKLVTVPAQQWVRDAKTRQDLQGDWVFTGSQLYPNPEGDDKPPTFAANSGDVICVSNFNGALLDLPINSPKKYGELVFEANTERIPPHDTKVTIILEPIPEDKKK